MCCCCSCIPLHVAYEGEMSSCVKVSLTLGGITFCIISLWCPVRKSTMLRYCRSYFSGSFSSTCVVSSSPDFWQLLESRCELVAVSCEFSAQAERKNNEGKSESHDLLWNSLLWSIVGLVPLWLVTWHWDCLTLTLKGGEALFAA